MNWRPLLRSRLAREVVAVLAALGLGAWWHSWHQHQAAVVSIPQTAEPTRHARKWKRHTEQRAVQVPTLTAAEVERLVKKYARPGLLPVPAPAGSTEAPGALLTPLAEIEDKRDMPAGFFSLTDLAPDGTITTTVVPRPVPFLGAPLRWRVFAEALTPDMKLDRLSYRAGVEFDALRIGSFHVLPKIEGFRQPLVGLDGFDTGALIGVRLSFDPR